MRRCSAAKGRGVPIPDTRWNRVRIGTTSSRERSLAYSFQHLVGPREQRWRNGKAERLGGLQIDDQSKSGRLVNWDFARLGSVEDLVDIIGHAPPGFADVALIGHQPTRLHILTIAIDRRQAAFLDQLDDQLPVREEVTYVTDHDRIWPLLCDFGERALILGWCRLLQQHGDHRDLQSSACFLIGWLKRLSIATFPRPTRRQECDLGHRRHGFLEDLEALL